MEVENHIVNISGGRTSAYLGWLLLQRYKSSENVNLEFVFCDTGAEHSLTYKFLRDIVDHWGIELTCLRTVIHMEKGVGPTWRVVDLDDCKQDLELFLDVCKKHGTPTVAAPLCTDRMKSIPADKYCDAKYGKGNYLRWIGYRIDEPNRIKKSTLRLMRLVRPKKYRKEFSK